MYRIGGNGCIVDASSERYKRYYIGDWGYVMELKFIDMPYRYEPEQFKKKFCKHDDSRFIDCFGMRSDYLKELLKEYGNRGFKVLGYCIADSGRLKGLALESKQVERTVFYCFGWCHALRQMVVRIKGYECIDGIECFGNIPWGE